LSYGTVRGRASPWRLQYSARDEQSGFLPIWTEPFPESDDKVQRLTVAAARAGRDTAPD